MTSDFCDELPLAELAARAALAGLADDGGEGDRRRLFAGRDFPFLKNGTAG